MNNKTILTITFLIAGTLLTSTVATVPAFAGGDDDDDHNGDGNKQKVEDDSAGALNDCDAVENEIEDNTFENINECIAIAATDESVVNDGDGNGNGEETAGFCHNPADGPPTNHPNFPQSAIDAHLAAQAADVPGHEDDHLGECEADET